ncbi:hypothetical protein M8542_02640 [Amycolatopsis sp. OK19-0408]|uniref:Uncharacterized protein n=1 Tax=Amycolatopsis iheyensis TaxID=2945988 RepID=A0A9X2SIX9_9PSEU|nr:hypothetical protein [Amycolatopsis iheyensis]MCR6481705.1 hypothetical protein [Amycolatopsis iheyensis]
MLNDVADVVNVDRSHFNAKLYADPMQPVGPPGRGISAVVPQGAGAPSPFGGYVSFGPGRTDFGGIPYIRYCIQTDGVCYVERPIMADTRRRRGLHELVDRAAAPGLPSAVADRLSSYSRPKWPAAKSDSRRAATDR